MSLITIHASSQPSNAVDGVTPRLLNDLQQLALDHTEPPVLARVETLDIVTGSTSSQVAIIRAGIGDQVVHATKADKVFLRVGDETRELSYLQRRKLTFDRGQAVYERSPLDGALDKQLVDSYAKAVGAPDAARLLMSRGLTLPEGAATVGGVLLFGLDPQAELPHAHVRVLRHSGTVAQTGPRQQLIADQRIEGPLPRQLVDARAAIKALLPTRQALGSDGRFGPIGIRIVPEDAWMEGLVNQSSTARTPPPETTSESRYSMTGSSSRVPDASQTSSICPPGLTRFARNPRIARVLADLRFGQEFGEGMRRMFDEMRLAGLADPEYYQTSGSVQLVLSARQVDRALDARLPSRWRAAMARVRERERVSTGDVATALDLFRPATIKLLRSMEEAELIEWVGKSAKDPRAYWQPLLE